MIAGVPSMATLGEYLGAQIADLSAPGAIGDLNSTPLNHEQEERLSRVEATAANTLLTAHAGIRSIGHVLAAIGAKNAGSVAYDTIDTNFLSGETLANLGYLVEGLAALAMELDQVATDAVDIRQQQDALFAIPTQPTGPRPVPSSPTSNRQRKRAD